MKKKKRTHTQTRALREESPATMKTKYFVVVLCSATSANCLLASMPSTYHIPHLTDIRRHLTDIRKQLSTLIITFFYCLYRCDSYSIKFLKKLYTLKTISNYRNASAPKRTHTRMPTTPILQLNSI